MCLSGWEAVHELGHYLAYRVRNSYVSVILDFGHLVGVTHRGCVCGPGALAGLCLGDLVLGRVYHEEIDGSGVGVVAVASRLQADW